MYFDCIIAGFGGQGVMLIGNILAYAAMAENKKITYMPVYGVEMRGGTANCTVVVSDREIGSPVIQRPISTIVMNKPSYDKFAPTVKRGGLIIANENLVPKNIERVSNAKTLFIPARDLAIEVGSDRLLNMVMLGALVKKSGIISIGSLKKALSSAIDERYHSMIPLNSSAIDKGAKFVETDC